MYIIHSRVEKTIDACLCRIYVRARDTTTTTCGDFLNRARYTTEHANDAYDDVLYMLRLRYMYMYILYVACSEMIAQRVCVDYAKVFLTRVHRNIHTV